MIADRTRENDTMSPVKRDSAASEAKARTWRELWAAYLELAKARLASMVILTALVGYVLGARGSFEPLELLYAVIGTALSAFGANILNQVLEEDQDRRMVRTRNRPLPAGRVILAFPGSAMVISHDRWFLDRIATHILAYEDDGGVVFHEGNFTDYEEDHRARLGAAAAQPHRVKYRKLK